jgi:dCMP deaminase
MSGLQAVTRPTWDEYFMDIAVAVSRRSDCIRRKVGAVIVSPDHRIVGTGYNGAPAGAPGCDTCPRRYAVDLPHGSSYDTGVGACVALHAEQNALIYTNRVDLPGATMYVTSEICAGCLKMASGAGIAGVHWQELAL